MTFINKDNFQKNTKAKFIIAIKPDRVPDFESESEQHWYTENGVFIHCVAHPKKPECRWEFPVEQYQTCTAFCAWRKFKGLSPYITKGIVFCGGPGSGKTLIKMNLIDSLKKKDVKSLYGPYEGGINFLAKKMPKVIIFDEVRFKDIEDFENTLRLYHLDTKIKRYYFTQDIIDTIFNPYFLVWKIDPIMG